jgi:hypothetical protein
MGPRMRREEEGEKAEDDSPYNTALRQRNVGADMGQIWGRNRIFNQIRATSGSSSFGSQSWRILVSE